MNKHPHYITPYALNVAPFFKASTALCGSVR
jgi:hypothetical protein